MADTLEQRARQGCTCEGCGQDYYGDLIVPDEVWAEIADSRELLCGACITDAIVLRGIWTAARAGDIDALQAQPPSIFKHEPLPDPGGPSRVPPPGFDNLAQQPGAQAVAFMVYAHSDEYGDVPLTTYAGSKVEIADRVMKGAQREGFKGTFQERMTELGWRLEPLYAFPRFPSIPEPSDEDVIAACCAFDPSGEIKYTTESMHDALTTYTARLRERIGGGS